MALKAWHLAENRKPWKNTFIQTKHKQIMIFTDSTTVRQNLHTGFFCLVLLFYLQHSFLMLWMCCHWWRSYLDLLFIFMCFPMLQCSELSGSPWFNCFCVKIIKISLLEFTFCTKSISGCNIWWITDSNIVNPTAESTPSHLSWYTGSYSTPETLFPLNSHTYVLLPPPQWNSSPLADLYYGKTNEAFNENEKQTLGLAVSDMFSNKPQSA